MAHACHEPVRLERKHGALLSPEVAIDDVSEHHAEGSAPHGEPALESCELTMGVLEVLLLHLDHFPFLLFLVGWDVNEVVLEFLESLAEVPDLLLEVFVLLESEDQVLSDDFLKHSAEEADADHRQRVAKHVIIENNNNL